jgi:hypothetical protein
MVVRKRAKAKRKKKATSTEEGEGVLDVNEEEELAEMEAERESDMREALFTFEAFELVGPRPYFIVIFLMCGAEVR